MLIRLLRDVLPRYRGRLAVVMLLQVVQTLIALLLPTLNANVIDNGVARGDIGYIGRTGGLMLLITLVQVVGALASVRLAASATMSMARDLRAAVFQRVQEFSAREMGRFGTASLITRTTNDVQQVEMLLLMGTTVLVGVPITFVGGVIMALRQDVRLSLLLVVVVPVLGAIAGVLNARLRPLFGRTQELLDRINRVLREQIMGIRVVRAFGRDEHERARFGRVNDDLLSVSLRVGRNLAAMMAVTTLVVDLSTVAVIWVGGWQVDGGGLQVGVLTAFVAYLMQILTSVVMATNVFVVVPRAEVSARRIREVLNTEPSVRPPAVPVAPAAPRGRLELRGVGFRYPGAAEPVLREISLLAEPGATTALIGSTGCGKSTALGLICRLMDCTTGSILIDGVDVTRLDPRLLATTVGLVPQRLYLFRGTVAGNLRYGAPEATDDQLWHALDVARAREFVERMPDGLNSPISQGGTNVSGGQRQRLAIARMVLQRPKICLLDDSFSALDHRTEVAVRAALATELASATVIIAAQRVSTIRTADRIVVLDDGKIAGLGTHAELLATNGIYRDIVRSQAAEVTV